MVTGTNMTQKYFLCDANKTELFHFITYRIAKANTIIVMKEELALSNQIICLDRMTPFSHEEVDTHIVHARHAVIEGS